MVPPRAIKIMTYFVKHPVHADPSKLPEVTLKRYLKNVMSDRANIATAEIGKPDNLTDQV